MSTRFDAKTQKWVDIPDDNTPKATTTNSPTSSTDGNSPTSNAVKITKEDGKSKDANKNYANQELSYLTGDCAVVPNEITLNTQAGNTVELKNLGKHLSGMYYVTEVKIDVTSSGTTLSYSVLKNGFGKTLKPYVPIAETSQQKDIPVSMITSLSTGDRVKFIESAEAVYSNASEGVKVPQWVKEKIHTVQKVTEDSQRVLLKEIQSWTYTKYLQKI